MAELNIHHYYGYNQSILVESIGKLNHLLKDVLK